MKKSILGCFAALALTFSACAPEANLEKINAPTGKVSLTAPVAAPTSIAVSYTHLDVYKRQV